MPRLDSRAFYADQGSAARQLASARGGETTPLPAPSVNVAFREAFFLENTVAAAMRLSARAGYEDVPGFSAFDPEQYDVGDYPLYIFEGSGSRSESDLRKQQFDDEVQARQSVARSGGVGVVASIAAGVVDPINALPVGAALGLGARTVKTLSSASLIARVTASGAAANALAELPLYASQFTRTPEESTTNILFGAAFGGILGTASAATRNIIVPRATAELGRADMNEVSAGRSAGAKAMELTEDMLIRGDNPHSMSEFSGAINSHILIEAKKAGADFGVRVPKGLPGRWAKKAIATHPINRAISSRITEVPIVARAFVESPLLHQGDFRVQSVETIAWLRQAEGERVLREMSFELDGMRKAVRTSGAETKISPADWWELVADASRDEGKLPLPWTGAIKTSVESAADRWLKFSQVPGQESVDLGAVRNLSLRGTAASYFPRVYNLEAIDADIAPDGRSLRGVITDLVRRHGSTEIESDMRKIIEGMGSGQLSLGGSSLRDIPGLSGPLHAREILLPDFELKPWMNNDPRDVIPVYARKVIPQLEFGKLIAAESPRYHTLRADLDTARTSAAKGNPALAADLLEDAQHLQTSGVFDAPRNPQRSLRARFNDGLIANLGDLRTRLRAAESALAKEKGKPRGAAKKEGLAAKKQAVAEAQAAVDAERAALATERKDAIAFNRILEGSERTSMKQDITFRKKLPVKKEAIERLVDDADGAVFRTMNMEFTRNSNATGFLHPTEGPVAIGAERLIAEARKTIKDPKKLAKEMRRIAKEKAQGISLLKSFRDIVQNRMGNMYKNPERWATSLQTPLRAMRAFNYMTDMPQVLLSSLADAGNVHMVKGGASYAGWFKFRMENALGSLMKNAKVPVITQTMEAMEHSLMGAKTAIQADILDGAMTSGVAGRAMDRAVNRYSELIGINWWNGQMRGNTSLLVMTRIIDDSRALAAGKTLSPTQLSDLAQVGITDDLARRIALNWEANRVDGDTGAAGQQRLANSPEWKDRGAARVLDTAIAQESRRAPLIPTAGGQPILMHHEVAKTMFQFKSFFIEMTNRALNLGIQRGLYLRDVNVLISFMLTSGLGMGIYFLKQKLSGREVSDDPRVWMFEGLDRGGFMGMIMEISNILEKSFGYGLGQAIAGQPASRFASRGIADTVFGPSVGTIEDTRSTLKDIFTGSFTKVSSKRLQSLIPPANVFYLRGISDAIRGEFDDLFNLPENKRDLDKRRGTLQP